MKANSFLIVLVPVVLLTAVFLMPDAIYKKTEKIAEIKSEKLRIVSLAPSVTEMLFSMGLGDAVVGITDYCDYPPQTKNIQHVGGFAMPNIEKILKLHPDLVITADDKRREILRPLEQSGIRILNLTIKSFEDIFKAFRQIGQATNHIPQAQTIINRMQEDLKSLVQKYHFNDIPNSQRPKVFMEIWHDPVTTVGRSSIINELIQLAGGVNVAQDVSGMYPNISPEKVIEWKPDVIIVCYMTPKQQNKMQMGSRIGWQDIPAVINNRAYSDIPRDLILRPGPRMVDGVRMLAEHLYGHQYHDTPK
ncbi:MAG: cobalamin-binding protein [Phycisphaerae bacterium]